MKHWGKLTNVSLMVAAGLMTLAACGGGTEEAATPSSQSTVRLVAQSDGIQAADEHTEPSLCDSLSAEEIGAAFGGKFVVSDAYGEETNCIYNLESVSGAKFEVARLIIETLPGSRYETTKGWEGNSGITFDYLEGLGQEAYVINDAEVWVLTTSTRVPNWWPAGEVMSVKVATQLITASSVELPISLDEVRACVIDLAGKLVARVES